MDQYISRIRSEQVEVTHKNRPTVRILSSHAMEDASLTPQITPIAALILTRSTEVWLGNILGVN